MKKTKKTPLIATYLFTRFIPEHDRIYFIQEIRKEYVEKYEKKGKWYAFVWFWSQLFKSIPAFLKNSLGEAGSIFYNYIKIAFRNIKMQKGYSSINILGLAVGMTCFILIMLYVKYEFSFDTFHNNSDRIYRVSLHLPTWNWRGSTDFAITTGALAPALMEEFPEVTYATRFRSASALLRYKKNTFSEQGLYADEYFLNVFSFPLVSGDMKSALKEPFSIILTERLAKKIFKKENPVGQVITGGKKYNFKVTGIVENVPNNSSIQFDFLCSINSLYPMGDKDLDNWNNINYSTYVKLKEKVSYLDFEKKLTSLIEKYHEYDSTETKPGYFLQPFASIHLGGNLNFELFANSDIKYIYIFSSIAVLILIIACINYVNCATARAAKRHKEIGIRKTIGAQYVQLIWQFLGESFISSFLAMIISLNITILVLPAFNSFVEREIKLAVFSDLSYVPALFVLFVIVGLVSGIYPAFLLSSFKPVNALKNNQLSKTSKNPLILRNVLVLLQFSITIILIIFSMVVHKQLDYIKLQAGFNRENIVEIRLRDSGVLGKFQAIKNDLLKNANILGVTFSSSTPVDIGNVSNAQIEGEKPGEMLTLAQVNSNYVDYNFFNVYDLQIVKGRNFSRDFTTDGETAVILNETAVRLAGLKNPIGKKFSRWDIKDGRIIGVVKDFHFTSFRNDIEPVIFQLKPDRALRSSIKIKSDNIKQSLDFIKSTFLRHNSNFVFDYQFIDDSFSHLYKAEQRLGDLVVIFSLIAIIIASLGLIGLISYITEQSTKEVGIRKTLGASVTSIIVLLSKDFMLLVAISNIIAWPIGYFIIRQWLQEFIYKMDIGLSIFLLAGFFTLVFAILTISSQTLKAANANPIDSLRYE